MRASITARLQAIERGGKERERSVHVAGLRGPALAVGTKIVVVTTDLTRQKFRETNPLDRIHVVDDLRTVPAMDHHLISAYGQFLGGRVYLRKWTKG